MAATLGLVFNGRPRMLPLALALLAAAITFGALSAAGASLTMASIAVLPVLVGLAVDYAIQFQARGEEELDRCATARAAHREPSPAMLDGPPRSCGARRRSARRRSSPPAAASAAAMLVLLLSPVPMVRGFGLLLVVGVAVALLCSFTAGAAAISLWSAHAGVSSATRLSQARWRQRGVARVSCWPTTPLTRLLSARRARRRRAPPWPRALRRPGARRARLGPGHADQGRDRHHEAGPPEPELAAEPEHARADHRCRRRNRADGRRQEPH